MSSGKFITFEGPDGAGKTTGLYWLMDYLRAEQIPCIQTREPGGTPIAEKLREILLTPGDEYFALLTEVMIVGAARAQHLHQVIRPHMAKGSHVICDRFADSTYAYQGHARGLRDEVARVESLVLGSFEPDQTLYFAADFDVRMARLGARSGKSDRLDNEDAEFYHKVAEGYEQRFKENPHRMYRIDANGDRESIQDQLREWADQYFEIPKG